MEFGAIEPVQVHRTASDDLWFVATNPSETDGLLMTSLDPREGLNLVSVCFGVQFWL